MTKKIIGLYQLITGLFGVVIILASLFSSSNISAILPQVIAGVALFGLLAWTGYGLLNKVKNAVKYSRILQALQIVSFVLGGSMYKFCAAAFIAVGFKDGHFTWGVAAKPIDFAITSVASNDFTIVIYIVPIIILYGLMKMRG